MKDGLSVGWMWDGKIRLSEGRMGRKTSRMIRGEVGVKVRIRKKRKRDG